MPSIIFKSVYRVKALYDYLGTRLDDLSFSEDENIKAHPSKDTDSDWWYGTSLKTNNCGFFPRTYCEVVEKGKSMKKENHLTVTLKDVSFHHPTFSAYL
jgi:SH3 domain